MLDTAKKPNLMPFKSNVESERYKYKATLIDIKFQLRPHIDKDKYMRERKLEGEVLSKL